MAFVLDATISGSTANSYSSIADAQDYFDGRLKTDKWNDATTADKEASLVQATRVIDLEVFAGLKADVDQSLQWPRTGVYDNDGVVVPTDAICSGIQNGTYELALWYLDEDNRLLSDQDLKDFDSYNLGPISVQVRASKDQLPSLVQQSLGSIGPGIWSGEKKNWTISR